MTPRFQMIVMGASAGGYDALHYILSRLAAGFRIPITVVQHLAPDSGLYMVQTLNSVCPLTVKEAEEKEPVLSGRVCFAPPNYHLLLEADRTYSLSIDPRVNFCRPSIDVLFESAADAYGEELIGILLTGANADGAAGMKKIKDSGGITIVQDPKTAEVDVMPRSAIELFKVDHVQPLDQMVPLISRLAKEVQR